MFSKVSLKDIQVFRLQTRPYQWVEFRNVSLQPGHKTHVTAVLSEPLFEPKQRQAGSPSQTTSAAGVSPVEEESTKKIKQALVSPTTLEFVDTPLSDVVDYLRDFHHIEIQLDKKALDNVGIASDTPITKSLRDVSLRSALRLVLKQLGLTYIIQGGMLLITTPEEADNGLETKVYPVGDLVLPPNSTAETSPEFEPLVKLIKSTVKPTAWEESGGVGSIIPFENSLSLTICQTQDVQEEVQQLLEQLRAAGREQIKEGRMQFKPRPKATSDAEREKTSGGEKKPAKSDPPPKPN